MDGKFLAYMGCLIAYAGDWARARAGRSRPASQPASSGLVLAAEFHQLLSRRRLCRCAACRRKSEHAGALLGVWGDDRGARATRWSRAAGDALQQLLRIKPDIARTVRDDLRKWFVDEELVERLIDGLRKTGLDAPGASGEIVTAPAADKGSSVSTARSIAVFPFANMSSDKDEDYFSDGLAEEIINLLAQSSGLKVIARLSAFAFRGKDEDMQRSPRRSTSRTCSKAACGGRVDASASRPN